MSNKVYDILNKVQRWLPALGGAILGIFAIWGIPLGDKINDTIIVVATLLAATLEVSTYVYKRKEE